MIFMLVQRAALEGPRWTRAVEDQSVPIPEEITSKLGGGTCRLVRRPQWANMGAIPRERSKRVWTDQLDGCRSFDAPGRGSTTLPLKK
jgi:hypothetical protein